MMLNDMLRIGWFASALMFVTCTGVVHRDRETELASVRWFEVAQRPSHTKNLKLRALECAIVSAAQPIRGAVPRTDTLQLDAITGACFVQQEPINSGLFYFIHVVKCSALGCKYS